MTTFFPIHTNNQLQQQRLIAFAEPFTRVCNAHQLNQKTTPSSLHTMAVSASDGANTAGVLDYLIEVLDT
jgi:hypothetical protein